MLGRVFGFGAVSGAILLNSTNDTGSYTKQARGEAESRKIGMRKFLLNEQAHKQANNKQVLRRSPF